VLRIAKEKRTNILSGCSRVGRGATSSREEEEGSSTCGGERHFLQKSIIEGNLSPFKTKGVSEQKEENPKSELHQILKERFRLWSGEHTIWEC